MLTKQQKVEFVEKCIKELKSYSVVGIIKLDGLPDRLLQSSKNKQKGSTRFIISRKTMLVKILEGDERTKKLVKELNGTCAIIASNEDPFELYRKFKASSIKLAAKPKQISPEDINIASGETSLQPGQVVTELKGAGIDVQIQKGKVVIAKSKVIVKKNEKISNQVAKALRIMNILPFNASLVPAVLLSNNLLYTAEVLGITKEQTLIDLTQAFNAALALSTKAGIINRYTIKQMIIKAYNDAMSVGLEAEVPDRGIIEKLLERAAIQANALNNLAAK